MTDNDFYVKDYEIKVRFFTDQLTRMWQRFNYFLVLETALFGGKIYTDQDLKFQIGFAVLGLFVSVFWYIMGSEDRYLVRVYRANVADAFTSLKHSLELPVDYYSAGDIYSYKEQMQQEDKAPENPDGSKKNFFTKRFNGWRIDGISTTQLAGIIPFAIMLVWIGILVWNLIMPLQIIR